MNEISAAEIFCFAFVFSYLFYYLFFLLVCLIVLHREYLMMGDVIDGAGIGCLIQHYSIIQAMPCYLLSYWSFRSLLLQLFSVKWRNNRMICMPEHGMALLSSHIHTCTVYILLCKLTLFKHSFLVFIVLFSIVYFHHFN